MTEGAQKVDDGLEMNALNRWALVGLALAWSAFMLAVIFLVWGADEATIDALRNLADFFADHRDTFGKLILTLAALVLLLAGLLLLVAELMPQATGDIRLGQVAGGTVVLAAEAITQRVEQSLLELPHIEGAKASVAGRGKGVELNLELLVAPESNITLVTEEAVRAARRTVEEKIGIPLLAMPTVRLRYSSPEPKPQAAPAPAPAEPPRWGPAPPAQEAGPEPPDKET